MIIWDETRKWPVTPVKQPSRYLDAAERLDQTLLCDTPHTHQSHETLDQQAISSDPAANGAPLEEYEPNRASCRPSTGDLFASIIMRRGHTTPFQLW